MTRLRTLAHLAVRFHTSISDLESMSLWQIHELVELADKTDAEQQTAEQLAMMRR